MIGRRSFLRSTSAVGAASLVALSGCSGAGTGGGDTGESPTGTPVGAVRQGSVTIEYVDVSGDRSAELYEPVLEELSTTHGREIELSFVEVPYENLKRQLLTRVGGGDAPDVAAIDQIWLGDFIEGGTLMSLNDVADDVGFDDYHDAFAEPARHDGHVYGIPIGTDVRGMYWNKRMFEDAGLDPDAPPETWSDLFDMASTVQDPPDQYGLAYFVVAGRWTVNLFAAGGRILSDDGTEPRFHEAPGVEAAKFVDDLYNTYDVAQPEPAYQNGAGLAREFLDGTHAIDVVEGSWLDYFWRNLGNDNEAMVEQFGFAPTPHPDGGEPATMSGGFVWTAFESTAHPRIVEDFMRIVGGREFKERLMLETGGIPTRASLMDVPEIWDQLLYGETIRELLDRTRLRPVSNWAPTAEVLDPALQRIAFDRQEPETALRQAAEEVRSELD